MSQSDGKSLMTFVIVAISQALRRFWSCFSALGTFLLAYLVKCLNLTSVV